ncbi:MAG: F0F1 ATP synthase subunit B [Clostridia bacterium]|nr:F0F1 ATP synthase subunit B [Clostridia bacterium]
MQTLGVISINLWQVLISLANLVILFFLLRKFLYKPVTKMLADRQSELDARYKAAEEAERSAEEDRKVWSEKMDRADAEAEGILREASEKAGAKSERIISEAKEKAREIMSRAEEEARLEYLKAQDDIKVEIVDLSTALAEKMLKREIKDEDHRELIRSFIDRMGDGDD